MLIYNKLIKVFRKLFPSKINFDGLVIGKSSILLSDSRIDFRVSKDDRHYVSIGEKCLINAQFIFESNLGFISIGDNVHIGGAQLISRNCIEIANDVTMAWDIVIYDHNSHSINWEDRQYDNFQCYQDYNNFGGNNIVNKNWTKVISKPIKIESKVWIGFGVTILKGITIGEGAVVGAKSVVTKDVPPWTVVVGNPAKVVKYLKKNES